MERQKSRDKEIELLLSALESDEEISEEIEALKEDADVVHFINTFNISPGPNKIKLSSFYLHYKKWSLDPISKYKFYGIIKRFFEFVKEHDIFLFIKNDLIDINNQVIREKRAKHHLRRSKFLRKHVESFIQEMDIKQDEKWIDIQTIYKWYIKWRYGRKANKLSLIDLKRLLKFYFQNKIGNSKAYFKLKGEFTMERIDQLRRKHNEEKTKQAVEGQVPSTKTGVKSKNQT